ncbi:MAG: glycosyltransferase [Proteobacteria bacterium]|nr:glycosyltransferase [Pseudomonadota bacterium]
MDYSLLVFVPGLFIWIVILLLPWRPWSTRESLDSQSELRLDLSDVTVLIPARNEALNITQSLSALKDQGNNLNVVIVDDQSTDNTIPLAESAKLDNLLIIKGSELLEGWSGKLWALEQGRQYVKTSYLLLLDADILLQPGLVSTLLKNAQQNSLQMISLMAHLKMQFFWEKLLMPAFIFFFKLLYPFHLSNNPRYPIAAAAGGCILLEKNTIDELGGFACIKDALIDDCSLAKKIKQKGFNTWIGLTHSAISIRNYKTLSSIWKMVARTAYTQLAYSPFLLLICTILMLFAFVLPLLALLQMGNAIVVLGLVTILLQTICYLPTLQYYSMSPIYAICLPLIGILYLIMTWTSAINYYFGRGASWKGRHYQ